MKVSIQLDNVEGDSVFTCTDLLSGTVLLALQRADAVSKVTLTLQGKIYLRRFPKNVDARRLIV